MAETDETVLNGDILLIFIIFLMFFLLAILFGMMFSKMDIATFLFWLINSFVNFVQDFFTNLGKSGGDIINASGDVVTNIGKFGINLSNNVIHDVGNGVQGKPTPQIDGGRDIKVRVEIDDETNKKPIFKIQ